MNINQNEGQMSLFADALLLQRGSPGQSRRERPGIQPHEPPQSEPLRPHQQSCEQQHKPDQRGEQSSSQQRDSAHRSLPERDSSGWGWTVDGGLQPASGSNGQRSGDHPERQYRNQQLPQPAGYVGLPGPECSGDRQRPRNEPQGLIKKQGVPTPAPLFNHPTAPHNGTETSIDAAESIKPMANAMALQVLRSIQASTDGLTCDQVEVLLLMKHQTASARIRDLATCEPPFIRIKVGPDGKPVRRKTRSGRTARVYEATAS